MTYLPFKAVFKDVSKGVKKIPKKDFLKEGIYPIIDQSKTEIAGYCNDDSDLCTDVPAIIFGDHTRCVKYISAPFAAGADGVKILNCARKDDNTRYLYHALKSADIPNLGYSRHFKLLKELSFRIYSRTKQDEVVSILDLIEQLTVLSERQLCKYDDLVKSQFIEMFANENYPKLRIEDYVNIIDGDRGKNYPKGTDFFDSEYCLFLNAKNVTKEGFRFENNQFITKEKDAALRKGKLKRGDVVLTTRGTVGNIAFYDADIPFDNIRINSGMVILRPSQVQCNQIFFVHAFKNKLSDVLNNVTGSAQPQLPISILKNIEIANPPIELQNKFASFIQQTDKSKFKTQQMIDKLQELYDSLAQEYFDHQ